MAQPNPDYELIATAMHGNCVFSDAESPANIQHLSGQAVVSVPEKSVGMIHFPLGFDGRRRGSDCEQQFLLQTWIMAPGGLQPG
jgi:hypothetical protein